MLRGLTFGVVTIALGLARDPGCSDVDDPNGGPNAPCTRDKDCQHGLRCAAGVCQGPDAGPIGDAAPE